MLNGACLCGKVGYEIEGKPQFDEWADPGLLQRLRK
jgi:hypothetical protein